MFKAIAFWPRRVLGWLLVAVGWVLCQFSGLLIFSGAWLMDRDDVVQEFLARRD